MKMIGVSGDFWYWRIRRAVSSPSMSGMLTSSRITANSRARISRSASEPERAVTISCPSSSRMLSKTSSFSGRSSTIRIAALSMQPPPQHGQEMQAVHRLGQVVPGARLDALLAVALHRLRRHRDDRQVAPALELADLADGG